jgi:hypothetical protein
LYRIKIKHWLIGWLLLLINLTLHSQTPGLDSLKKNIPLQKDTQQVNTYLKIAKAYYREIRDTDSLRYYSEVALNRSKQINYIQGGIGALTSLGLSYAFEAEFTTSIQYWQQASRYAQLIHDNSKIADLESKFGYSYQMMDNYEEATRHYLKSAAIFEELKNYNELGNIYHNLSSVFATQEQKKESHYYCRKALGLIPQINDQRIILNIYIGAASLYGEDGIIEKNYLDSSILYADIALQLAQKLQNNARIAQSYSILASSHFQKKGYPQFLYFIKKAENYRDDMEPSVVFQSYIHYTDYYLAINNNTMACRYMDSVLSSPLITYDTYYKMIAVERGFLVNKKLGNTGEALKNLEILRTLEDSMLRLEKNKVINDLEQKYNKVKNEKAIVELGQEKDILNKKNQISHLKVNLLIVGAIILLLVIMIILVIYRQRVLNQKRKVLEAELRLSRSRLNPHFFFNAMAALQSQALSEQNPQQIALYLSKYAKIMRLTLEDSYNNLVSIESELDFIQQYMDLQKLRLKNKFTYTIKIGDEVETSLLMIPSMILQPFIENSIEHGFLSIDYPGLIYISIHIEGKSLKIEMNDNGMGNASERHIKEFPSRATSILQDRLFLFGKQVKQQARFEMFKKENEKGFQVILYLPIINSQ